MIAERPRFSYRQDRDVPAFDDFGPILVMDGECALCALGARTILRLDRQKRFRVCPSQSRLGQALLTHYGIDADDPEGWLYLNDGRARTSLDAMISVGMCLRGLGLLLQPLRLLPVAMQDRLYRLIARNRYRLTGRADLCELPDLELRSRIIR